MRAAVQNNLRLQLRDEIADLRLALFVRCLRRGRLDEFLEADHSGADRTLDRATSPSAAALFHFFPGEKAFATRAWKRGSPRKGSKSGLSLMKVMKGSLRSRKARASSSIAFPFSPRARCTIAKFRA